MKTRTTLSLGLTLALGAVSSHAQIDATIAPLSGFG